MDRVGWFEFLGAFLSFVAGWFTPSPLNRRKEQ